MPAKKSKKAPKAKKGQGRGRGASTEEPASPAAPGDEPESDPSDLDLAALTPDERATAERIKARKASLKAAKEAGLQDGSMVIDPAPAQFAPSTTGTQSTQPPPKKKRSRKAPIELTEKQKDDLVDWIQAHPEVWNQASEKWQKPPIRERLWQERADEMSAEEGCPHTYQGPQLKTWYLSMRTKFGKLSRELKSGAGARDLQGRSKWIYERFQFIAGTIIRQPRRQATSLVSSHFYMYFITL